MAGNSGIHSGHRDRLKTTYIENGLDGFSEINTLELILFYAIPRRDTNELAHALIKKFGSLDDVFDASIQELMEVDGIGESTAALISLFPAALKKAAVGRSKRGTEIRKSAQAAEFLKPYFMGEKDEKIMLVCMDVHNRVICCTLIAKGNVDEVDVNVRLIAQTAMKSRASKVIISHNHPNGSMYPSAMDQATTESLRNALHPLGITLSDHIIICERGYVSIGDLGIYSGMRY